MSFTGKRFRRGFGYVFLAVLLLSFLTSLIILDNDVSALPSNFGVETIGTYGAQAVPADNFCGLKATSGADAEGAVIENITWYGHADAGTVNVKAVLVSESRTIIAVSNTLTVDTTAAWHVSTFDVLPKIEANTIYYLGLIPTGYLRFYYNYVYDTGLYDSSNSYSSPTDPTDATVTNWQFSIYATYRAPNINLSSSPEINADVTVNGTDYSTPDTLDMGLGNYTFTAESSKVYNVKAYTFDHWLVNDTDSYETESVTLNITAPTTLEAHYTELSGVFTFYGPFNETTGEQLDENVTVTAHYADDTDIPDYSFILNGGWVYPPDYSVQYFEFLFDDGTTRQYWIDPSEIITDLYVFKATDPTSYVINFLDYTGVLQTYPYVTIKASVNGTLYTVEKRKVDEQNSIGANLILGEKYQLVIGNDEYSFVYGDMLATATTGVQLILRGVDFPKETLLMFKNVVLYGLRDFSSSSISFYYADSLNATTSVNVVFTDSLGTVAYNQTFTADYVNLNWTSAVNATSYQLDVSVVHEEYGDFTWSQYFTNEAGEGPAIFDFSFLGTWTVDMTYLFPAILILFVAACFSALNAEVGAVLTVIVAALLTWIGWIPIPAGFLVAALALAILMALVYNKRRGAVY